MIWCHHIVLRFNEFFHCKLLVHICGIEDLETNMRRNSEYSVSLLFSSVHELFQGYYFCQAQREDFFQRAKPYKGLPTILRKSHISDGPGYQEIYFNPGDTGFKVFHTKLQKLELCLSAICWDQWFPEILDQFELWFSKVQKPQDTGLDSRDHWKRVMQGHAGANLGVGRLGAAAVDMSLVALRIVEAYWEYCLQPWDMAAGVLLLE
ncbi:N-carbamoylputrescine amidase-like [Rhododendron vialii]|uniref:N-carbamoylputrescine amidase-like n=1 Tax=Rhododendron vialii TaxID=182163 RepID=UPI00265E391A|nr:N-carbamoylputrescine amidase-like [Rhododendron vialii]